MTRPAAWLPDPLDDALVRYWDGHRWTFHTAVRQIAQPVASQAPPPAAAPPQPVTAPTLRPDIAAAVHQTRGALMGSMKEINLLAGYLHPEERVLALTSAQGEGFGVLVCTDRRLLFLFAGLVRRQFVQADWNQVKGVTYDRTSKAFSVYTTKPTRRAIPAMTVRVARVEDAQAVAQAAQVASQAPRLDVF
ncbi:MULTISPECIES: DUF2510 domain-containing protein [unclassified Saccharothrix]|uniref:DUF2510 domain-containing protein n=1 Tax=unclassified Saccharothrix TaxID=2593673 RepID=UPI00307D5653